MKLHTHELKNLGRVYRKTKIQYPGFKSHQVVYTIYKNTKMEWTYEELRKMTGYSVFTISASLGVLRRKGFKIAKIWHPDFRSTLYRVYA